MTDTPENQSEINEQASMDSAEQVSSSPSSAEPNSADTASPALEEGLSAEQDLSLIHI